MGRALLHARIQKKDREEKSPRLQYACDGLDIISSPRGRDRAETGVLNHPIKASGPLLRQGEEITPLIAFPSDWRMAPCHGKGGIRKVETDDLGSVGREKPDIVSGPASRYEHLARDILSE